MHHPPSYQSHSNRFSPAHAGLFYELLNTVRLPFYLTLLNNFIAMGSISIIYRSLVLLSVKPAITLLNKINHEVANTIYSASISAH